MVEIKLPLTPSELTSMSGKDFLKLVGLFAATAGAVHLAQTYICDKKNKNKVNNLIKLDNPKVVDVYKMSDMQGQGNKFFCRCWKSKNWPYCDGSHAKHNQETGDNLGPIGIKDE